MTENTFSPVTNIHTPGQRKTRAEWVDEKCGIHQQEVIKSKEKPITEDTGVGCLILFVVVFNLAAMAILL